MVKYHNIMQCVSMYILYGCDQHNIMCPGIYIILCIQVGLLEGLMSCRYFHVLVHTTRTISPITTTLVLVLNHEVSPMMSSHYCHQHPLQEGQRALDHIQRSAGLSQGLNRAMQHKDKLLEFDQTR